MDQLSKSEIETLALECYKDPVLFCRTFLRHWFPTEMPWFHRGILAILLHKTDFLLKYGELEKIVRNFVDTNGQPMFYLQDGAIHLVAKDKIGIMIPRGFSKTTLVNGALIYTIEYQDCLFPLMVSEAGKHANTQLGNIKRELESNQLLLQVFGVKAPGRQDPEKWTEEFITTLDGIALAARGRGSQVRGLNFNAHRPDFIVVDDVEDKESVSTADQRKKTRGWFYGDLLPCRAKRDARVVVLGTLLHKEALLTQLERDPSWTFVRFGAVDRDGELLWEYNMSQQQLDAEKTSYALAGALEEFYMEYFSELRNESTAKFRGEFIKHEARPPLVAVAIAMDPAISESRTADDATIGVVGMTEQGKIHVCECWGKKGASPRELIDKYFELVFQHNPTVYGVESVAYQAALIHLLREEMFRKHKYFEIVPITHHSHKAARILGILQPRYAAGYVTHERVFPKLEQQLLDYNGKEHDDYPDVIAMAIALLDPFAAAAADPDKDLGTDEYEELDYGEYCAAP